MLNYHVGGHNISQQVRKKWSGIFNNMPDNQLLTISQTKRKGIATQKALLAQEILWKRSGESDTSWKLDLFLHKLFVEEHEY